MSTAYIDASAFLALLFEEPSASAVAERIGVVDRLASSNLLSAEVRSAAAREGVALSKDTFGPISWILPDRPLDDYMQTVLEAGHLTGADLWHVATALSLVDDPGELAFITLDQRQFEVASALGFMT